MQPDGSIDGSPQNDQCANTDSEETANNSSLSENISPAANVTSYAPGPVPLFLIPQAIATEIHKLGDAILEVHIQRTSGHTYHITVKASLRRREDHAA